MNIFFIEKTKKNLNVFTKTNYFQKVHVFICSPHLAALVIRGKPREKINVYTSFNICLTARRPLGQDGGKIFTWKYLDDKQRPGSVR